MHQMTRTTSEARVSQARGSKVRMADHRKGNHRGMVTAELAAALIVVAMAAVACAWLVGVLVLQVRLVDVAGEVARQAARGDEKAVAEAKADAPKGASISVDKVDGAYRVTASAPTTGLGPLPTWPLTAEAEVLAEAGVN